MLDSRHLKVLCFLVVFLSLMKSVYSEEGNSTETGAEFLQSVIGKMHGEHVIGGTKTLDLILDRIETKFGTSGPEALQEPSGPDQEDYRILGPTPVPGNEEYERYPPYAESAPRPATAPGHGQGPTNPGTSPDQQSWVPPLNKNELLALYQAAMIKGSALNLNGGSQFPTGSDDNGLPNFNMGNLPNNINPNNFQGGHIKPLDQGSIPGYQYYFYPISSFMPNQGNELGGNGDGHLGEDPHVLMLLQKHGMKKKVEPLFLAMAGFVGVAMMFIVTVLFLPKIGQLHDKVSPFIGLKQAPQEFSKLSKLVIEAIEGKDCTERITCEVGRAFRSMHVGNKPIRMMEIMLPSSLAQPLAKIRKAYIKKEKCHYIPCRRNAVNKKNDLKSQQLKPKSKKAEPLIDKNKIKKNKK